MKRFSRLSFFLFVLAVLIPVFICELFNESVIMRKLNNNFSTINYSIEINGKSNVIRSLESSSSLFSLFSRTKNLISKGSVKKQKPYDAYLYIEYTDSNGKILICMYIFYEESKLLPVKLFSSRPKQITDEGYWFTIDNSSGIVTKIYEFMISEFSH